MRRAASALLGLGLLLGLAAGPSVPAASASKITYACGDDLCRIDPAKPRKVNRLTRDGTSRDPYVSVSVSPSGRRMAFFRGKELFFASASGKGRRRLESRSGFPGQTFVGPDGFQVAAIESVFLPNICPVGVYACGSSYKPVLYLHRPGEDEPQSVASSVVSAGWLGDRLMRDDDPDGGGPQVICVLVSNDDNDCERTVAADPAFALFSPAASRDGRFVAATKVTPEDAEEIRLRGRIGLFDPATGALVRDLTNGTTDRAPSFSPDGRQVAFNRGDDLYVVRTDGSGNGRARLLRRNAVGPSWSR